MLPGQHGGVTQVQFSKDGYHVYAGARKVGYELSIETTKYYSGFSGTIGVVRYFFYLCFECLSRLLTTPVVQHFPNIKITRFVIHLITDIKIFMIELLFFSGRIHKLLGFAQPT